jgi:hypothetical protein
MIEGKLEVTIKITELPAAKTVENGWKQFEVNCDGRVFNIKVKPKIWNKLDQAQRDFPMWVGAITGKLGSATPNGFILEEPSIQVFEKKPREPKPEPAAEPSAV